MVIKLCVFTDFFVPDYYGGGQVRYHEILKRLVKLGYDVTVFCMRKKNSPTQEYIDGIRVIHIGEHINNPPNRTLLQLLDFLVECRRIVKMNKHDIYEAQGVGTLALPRDKSVGLIHDIGTGEKGQWQEHAFVANIFEKFMINKDYGRTLTVSNNVRDKIIERYKKDRDKVVMVHNGVDLERLDSIKADMVRNRVVFVGRLVPHKNVADLIKAVSLVQHIKNKLNNISLHIVGTGQEMNKLKQLANELELKSVSFLHNLDYDDVIREIKQANVLVLPSSREGFGMVIAEAFACMTPVIAYTSDGACELIRHNKNGLITDSNDYRALSRSLIELLSSQRLGVRLANKARDDVVEKYQWKHSVSDLNEMYIELIKEVKK